MMSQPEGNKFEHILYEFYIYLASYEYISSSNADIKNIAFECHVIHLRNLSYFFAARKKHNGWHVSEVLVENDAIPLLSSSFADEINMYASRTTGHLSDDRLAKDYKDRTSRTYFKAFPKMKTAIEAFLSNADKLVRPELRTSWKDPYVQDQAGRVLLQLASIDSGWVQALGQSSMMSAPTTSTAYQPAFAPTYSLGAQAAR